MKRPSAEVLNEDVYNIDAHVLDQIRSLACFMTFNIVFSQNSSSFQRHVITRFDFQAVVT